MIFFSKGSADGFNASSVVFPDVGGPEESWQHQSGVQSLPPVSGDAVDVDAVVTFVSGTLRQRVLASLGTLFLGPPAASQTAASILPPLKFIQLSGFYRVYVSVDTQEGVRNLDYDVFL